MFAGEFLVHSEFNRWHCVNQCDKQFEFGISVVLLVCAVLCGISDCVSTGTDG